MPDISQGRTSLRREIALVCFVKRGNRPESFDLNRASSDSYAISSTLRAGWWELSIPFNPIQRAIGFLPFERDKVLI